MTSRKRVENTSRKPRKPARSPEARESQMISLANDLAERQILDGTASSQVITHFLKLGSSRERLEQERLELENKLSEVKREAIESQQRVEAMYAEALSAMRDYSGLSTTDEYLDDEFDEDV